MRLGRWWALATLPLVAVAAGGVRAAPPTPASAATSERDPLAAAAVDTWPMQDGCPARTRATATRAILGDTVTAWTFEAPGSIEGDPRLWGDWVVVASHSELKKERYLDVLRLTDGKPVVSRKRYPALTTLRPVLWQDFVFVRADVGVDVLRIVPELQMFSVGQKIDATDTPLVLPDGDLIFQNGGRVERRRLGQSEPIWTANFGAPTTGSFSARGDAIYAVTAVVLEGFEGRQLRLESLALSDGAPRQVVPLGWEDKTGDGSMVVVGRDEVFALHPTGVRLKGGASAEGSRADLIEGHLFVAQPFRPRDGVVTAGSRSFFSYPDRELGEVLAMSAPGEPDPAVRSRGGWTYAPLATGARHAPFANEGAGAVIARNVHLGSAGAFDIESLRVIESSDAPRSAVRIPARESMLIVASPTRLEAHRAPNETSVAAGPRLPADPSRPRVDLPGATSASVDGVLSTGSLAFDVKGRRVTGGREARRLEDVGLVLDKGGRIVHGPDAAFVARALPRVARGRTRAQWIALARKTVHAHEPVRLRRAIADVIEHGGRQDDVVIPLQRALTLLENPTAVSPKPDPRRIAEIDALRAELERVEAKSIWTAFASLADDVPFAYRIDVLRAVLDAEEAQPDAVNWLKARVPAGIVAPEPFPAASWLELVEAAAQTPLRGVNSTDGKGSTFDERALAAARARWRPDLVGLRSERLLVVTSLASPAGIARCLSLGELVCRTLDTMFDVSEKSGAAVEPLVMYLHESKEDYVAHSASGGAGPDGKSFVEWTLGHYSPSDGISRLFVPAERDAFERVMRVFAHELTHHWLDKRLPRATGSPAGAVTPRTPAYFLEEGFATMVEEFVFDLRARTARTLDAHADSLDVVAASPTLLPWESLVNLCAVEFHALDRVPSVEIPCRWTIGMHRNLSRANLFYSQAAAICHFLYEADGTKFRPALLAWVQDFHAGRTKVGDLERRLGVDGQQLGEATLAWSRRISAGR